jgi:hypothetical protein
MSLPGFTAEASAYATTKHYYSATAVGVTKSASVQPQSVLPPWTPCRWLRFCCLEFGDGLCCEEWSLRCIPQ